jgi:hypothetical protein
MENLDRHKYIDLRADLTFDMSIANLALRLANIFTSLAPEHLDAEFLNTREIQLPKADKVVAMEMVYVKSFEKA